MIGSLLPLFAIIAPMAAAAETPAEALAKIDAAISRGQDAHLVLAIKTTDEGGAPVTRTLEIWQKGNDKRLIRFKEPARLAGTALLVPDGETVYLYLPSYGRSRRIVGASQGDSFVGTDFAMEDLARTSWGKDFVAAPLAANSVRLTPKPGVTTASAKVDVEYRESDHLPLRVTHYDAAGATIRRITFGDVRDIGGRPLAHSVAVEDLKKSRVTEATVTLAELDRGISDEVFSVTQLAR